MRTVKAPLALSSILILTAAAGPSQLIPHFLVRPGPVTGDRNSGINGSFTLTQATAADAGPEGGITSDQLGGACIIFRVQDLNFHLLEAKSCTQDDDCATSEPSAHYCGTGGQCWARPLADPDPLCRKSGDTSPPQAWNVGETVPISASPIPVAPYQLQPNSQAVVVALTRGKPQKFRRAVLTWGEPTTIP